MTETENMVTGGFRNSFLASLIVLFFALTSNAQMDPTSGMLLEATDHSGRDGGLDSGRYTVKKRAPKKQQAPQPTPSPTPGPQAEEPASVNTLQPPPIKIEPSQLPQASPVPVSPTESATVETLPQPLPPSGNETEVQPTPAARFDRRNTIVELSLSPTFIYNDSKSSYWYRSYQTSSPGAHLEANVWLTEKLGLHTSFLTSLGGSVKDSVDQSRTVEASHTWFDLGARFRHFASDAPDSSQITFGVDYSEYRFKAPPSAMMRHRYTTSGVQLKAGVEVPTSKSYTWTAEVSLVPKAQHIELETRSIVKSGTSNETNAFGASIGGAYRIDSSHSYFWRVSHRVEKNVFSGVANAADPISNVTPKGVSVSNSFTLFEIGCTWGD